ncbi:MAG: 30S ribosomal protein S6 [Enhygromyxa sp.]
MSQASIRSYSALRDTQREFETTIIIRPDIQKEGIADLVNRLQRIYGRNGGRMQKIDNWGLRTLAYPIQGHKKGVYLYVRFLGGSDMVKELERNLGIWDEVVRYLTVVVDGDVDPEARPSDIDDEILDAASDVAPDPLDIAAEKAAALAHGYDDDDDDDDGRRRHRRRDDDDDDDDDDDEDQN